MPDRDDDNYAAPDELGDDPGQVGPESAGQSGDSQGLSSTEDMNEESVEQLAEDDQAFEASAVLGVEEAADHPERPVHTHQELPSRADDIPPQRGPEDVEDDAA
jgi:N utilization substance protein A